MSFTEMKRHQPGGRLKDAASEPPRVSRRLHSEEDGVMARPSRLSPEVRERAVRMVFEHA